MKNKARIYAIYQFLSLISLLLFLMGVFIFALDANSNQLKIDVDFWSTQLKGVLSFEATGFYLLGSVVIYIGLSIMLLSWMLSLTLIKLPDRNFFDSLFLLFFFIPLISNLFALFAQLSFNSKEYTTATIDKDQIKQQKTQIIKLFDDINKKSKSDEDVAKAMKEITKITPESKKLKELVKKAEEQKVKAKQRKEREWLKVIRKKQELKKIKRNKKKNN